MKRILLAILMLMLLIGSMVPLAAPVMADTAPDQPPYGGRLKLVGSANVTNMGNPDEIAGPADAGYTVTVCEGLLALDADGNLIPWLATSYEITPDGSYVVFHLRQGVKFHDGTDFDAASAKYNMDLRQNNQIYTNFHSVSSTDIIDGYTIKVNFVDGKFDWNVIFSLASAFFGSEFSLAALQNPDKEWLRLHPVGTGPFKFASYMPDDSVKFDRFDQYWGGAPYLDGVDYLIIPDYATALAAFEAGQVHAYGIQPQDAAGIIAGGFPVVESNNVVLYPVLVPDSNNPDSPFADIRVRQALEYAIDKQAIADALGYGYATPSNQPFIPGQACYNPAVAGYPYNPAEARRLLAEAGYTDNFATQMLILNTSSLEMPNMVQADAAAVGINIQLNIVSLPVFANMIFTSGWQGLMYGLGLAGTGVEPGFSLSLPLNDTTYISNWKPPELVTLAQNAKSELNPDTRMEIYRQISKKMTDDYAQWCWLYHPSTLLALSPRLHDTAIGQGPFAYTHAWLEPPPYGGRLKLVGSANVTNMGNPDETAGPVDAGYTMTACEGLLALNANGNLIPWLATSYEIAPDGSYVIFHLRQGVKFHDGTDFNAASAKYNMDLRQNSQVWTNFHSVSSTDILDGYTIKVNFVDGKFDWNVMYSLAGSFLGWEFSPAALQNPDKEWLRLHPVGTGPFKFASYTPDDSVKFDRFDQYWGGAPYLDGVDYLIIPDYETALAAFEAGQVHAYGIQLQDAAGIIAGGFPVVESNNVVFNMALVPDSNNPDSPFANIRVRQALEYAIDKQAIADALGYGYATPTNQPFIPGQAGYNPAVAGYPYNPTEARRLLAEAGYADGFTTQMLIIDWMSLEMPNMVQADAAAVGINIQFNIVSPLGFVNMLYNGWQGLVFGLSYAGTGVEPGVSLSSGPLNENTIWVSNWEPPELVTLAQNADSEINPDTRMEMYRQISKKMIDDYAQWCWLYYPSTIIALSPRLHDTAIGQGPFAYTHAWLEPANLTSIDPNTATGGGGEFILNANGALFMNGAILKWRDNDGIVDLATTFVSTTHLSATVPESLVSEPKTAEIYIQNPDGGISNWLPLFVTETGTTVTESDSGTSTASTGNATASIGGEGPSTPDSLTATASGSGTVVAAEYESNPGGTPSFMSTDSYFDVYLSYDNNFTSVTIVACNLNGGDIVYWWNGTAWVVASDQVYDPVSNSITITITDVTTPNLNDLSGSIFGVATKIDTITFTSSWINTSVYGQPVRFTVLVLPRKYGFGMPTGTVTFKDEETTLGIVTLDRFGPVSYSTTSLSVGNHSITAVYSGDDMYNGSSSFALNQRVYKAKTSTIIASSINPSVYRKTVTFTATVRAAWPGSGIPTGIVTFKDGYTILGTGTLDGLGRATFSTSSLFVGGHYITAIYAGDSDFNGNTSYVLSQRVNPR